jgi:hypothetical protein
MEIHFNKMPLPGPPPFQKKPDCQNENISGSLAVCKSQTHDFASPPRDGFAFIGSTFTLLFCKAEIV